MRANTPMRTAARTAGGSPSSSADALHAGQGCVRGEYQCVGRVEVGPRGGRQVVAAWHPDDQVALELLGQLVTRAQRVAHEAHALREVGVFQLAVQVMCERLGDLVLVALAARVGLRQVAGIGAYPQRRRLWRRGCLLRAGGTGHAQHCQHDRQQPVGLRSATWSPRHRADTGAPGRCCRRSAPSGMRTTPASSTASSCCCRSSACPSPGVR